MLDLKQTREAVGGFQPAVIIHTQALSDVDSCQQQPDLAFSQNIQTTKNIIQAAEECGALLVYLSSDYVFSGRKGSAYLESDATDPISVYGQSKLEGERVTLAYAQGLVVRPSTLFGAARMNFCDAIVRAAKEGGVFEAFIDQTTSPTYTVDLAEALGLLVEQLAGKRLSGNRVFHATNAGSCTRVSFAYHVVDLLGCSRSCIRPIRMSDQKRPAPRPACSALDSTELPRVIGRKLRKWEEAVSAYLRHRHWIN